MEFVKKIAKAVAGGIAAGGGAIGTTLVVIPDGVVVPWYGYFAVALVNAAWVGFLVYRVPNK